MRRGSNSYRRPPGGMGGNRLVAPELRRRHGRVPVLHGGSATRNAPPPQANRLDLSPLRSDGSHYLKAIMDAVFGRHQFRNEIIRRRNESGAKGSQHGPKTWGTNTDSLLYYAKGKKATFDPRVNMRLTEAEIMKRFPRTDAHGERYKTKPSAWRQPSMGPRPNLCYAFHGIKPPYPSGWRFGRVAWKRNTRRATSLFSTENWNGDHLRETM